MERQRQLERCGWSFWRVGGYEYYRDPDEALHTLWETLGRFTIYPEQQWSEERYRKEETHSHEDEDSTANDSTATIDADDIDNDFEEFSDNATDLFETFSIRNKKSPSIDDSGRLERALAYDRALRRQRPETLSAITIQKAIIAALSKCPNNTCTEKSITSRVLKELDIATRGNPRAEFERRVKRNIGTLKRKELIEEYKAKNKRLRLLDGTRVTQEVLRFED
jgi:hypothetical protein